jgi:hypothetical protein
MSDLTQAQIERLKSLKLTPTQKREVWDAWQASPGEVELLAERARAFGAREGTSGAGLLLTMLRRGDHLLKRNPRRPRVTGWRFVRGTHSGTYVPDPAGIDQLPQGYGQTG